MVCGNCLSDQHNKWATNSIWILDIVNNTRFNNIPVIRTHRLRKHFFYSDDVLITDFHRHSILMIIS